VEAVLGIEDQHRARRQAGTAVGKRPAGGDASAQVEGDEGFAQTGIAVEDGELAKSQAVRPQPLDRARRQLAQALNEEGSTRRFALGHGCSGGKKKAGRGGGTEPRQKDRRVGSKAVAGLRQRREDGAGDHMAILLNVCAVWQGQISKKKSSSIIHRSGRPGHQDESGHVTTTKRLPPGSGL
jgi:hypothetical protein